MTGVIGWGVDSPRPVWFTLGNDEQGADEMTNHNTNHNDSSEGVELDVCADCLIWVVNGDDTRLDMCDEDTAAEVRARRDAALAAIDAPLVHDDTELGFMWSDCDVCKALPSDRYRLVSI